MSKFYRVKELSPAREQPLGFSAGFVIVCSEPGKEDRNIGNGFAKRSEAEAKRDELQAVEDARDA